MSQKMNEMHQKMQQQQGHYQPTEKPKSARKSENWPDILIRKFEKLTEISKTSQYSYLGI
jgi:hypothetical protein